MYKVFDLRGKSRYSCPDKKSAIDFILRQWPDIPAYQLKNILRRYLRRDDRVYGAAYVLPARIVIS